MACDNIALIIPTHNMVMKIIVRVYESTVAGVLWTPRHQPRKTENKNYYHVLSEYSMRGSPRSLRSNGYFNDVTRSQVIIQRNKENYDVYYECIHTTATVIDKNEIPQLIQKFKE